MPAAKLSPKMRRFFSTQRLTDPGVITTSDDAANAIKSHGTANRTDSAIIDATAAGSDRFLSAIPASIVAHIGTAMSANRYQPFRYRLRIRSERFAAIHPHPFRSRYCSAPPLCPRL